MTLSTDVVSSLSDGVLAGHPPSVARAITLLESRRPGFEDLGEWVWAAGGRARLLGITGPPGTGKSTLTNALVKELRRRDRRVAVVAVDPSSPVTGGAILGDRIRMSELNVDDGVFVRSLSSRGSLGGVSAATVDAVAVFDAAGYDDVIIETVGVGQAEVDIVGIAHTVAVISVPGLGDDVQMIKAGLFELADIHVVNKADRPEAQLTVAQITSMLTLTMALDDPGARRVPVVETIATTEAGVAAFADAVDGHVTWLRESGGLEQRLRRAAAVRIREIAKELLVATLHDPSLDGGFDAAVEAVVRRDESPYAAASGLFRSMHIA